MNKLGINPPPARHVKKVTLPLIISEIVTIIIFVGLAYFIGEICCG